MINPATRNLTSEIDPKTYFGGIWSSVDLEKYNYPMEYTSSDVADYYHDLSLLDDFPLPSVEGEPRKYLNFAPWEEHIKSMTEAEVPLVIPDEWDPAVIEQGGSTFRSIRARFPCADELSSSFLYFTSFLCGLSRDLNFTFDFTGDFVMYVGVTQS